MSRKTAFGGPEEGSTKYERAPDTFLHPRLSILDYTATEDLHNPITWPWDSPSPAI